MRSPPPIANLRIRPVTFGKEAATLRPIVMIN